MDSKVKARLDEIEAFGPSFDDVAWLLGVTRKTIESRDRLMGCSEKLLEYYQLDWPELEWLREWESAFGALREAVEQGRL